MIIRCFLLGKDVRHNLHREPERRVQYVVVWSIFATQMLYSLRFLVWQHLLCASVDGSTCRVLSALWRNLCVMHFYGAGCATYYPRVTPVACIVPDKQQ